VFTPVGVPEQARKETFVACDATSTLIVAITGIVLDLTLLSCIFCIEDPCFLL
jgi:hypothetical protein